MLQIEKKTKLTETELKRQYAKLLFCLIIVINLFNAKINEKLPFLKKMEQVLIYYFFYFLDRF